MGDRCRGDQKLYQQDSGKAETLEDLMQMKLRALVIDDSGLMRTRVIKSLRETQLAEWEFTEAQDGSDGLDKFSPNKTDIVFVDWNMPKLSGIDFVRTVRASGKTNHIPMIMVTTESSLGKIQQAMDGVPGVDDYITKPFTVEQLQRSLTRLLPKLTREKPNQPAAALSGFFSRLRSAG
jgi:two-component system chemotaxis response regulator CheY